MAADFRAPFIPNGVQETGCKKQGKGDKCHGNVDSATLSSVRKDHAAYISSTIFPSVPRCNGCRGISTDRVIFPCENNTRLFLTDLTRIAPVIRIDRVHFSFNLRANKSIIGRRAEGEGRDRSFNRFQVDRSIGFVGAHLGRPIFRCFGTE